jgi:hypothetical protein
VKKTGINKRNSRTVRKTKYLKELKNNNDRQAPNKNPRKKIIMVLKKSPKIEKPKIHIKKRYQ